MAIGFTYYLTGLLPYYPLNWRSLLILAVGFMWILKPVGGLIFTLAVYILPIAYNSITLAILYLLFILTGVAGPYGFLVMAVATVIILILQITVLLPVAPLMAGFVGRRRGVLLAVLTCFLVEILALLRGQVNAGLVMLGTQTKPLLSVHTSPVNSLLDFKWLKTSTVAKSVDLSLLSKLFTPFIERPILIAQIVLWAVTAGVVGTLLDKLKPVNLRAQLTAISSGTLILFLGSLILPVLILGSNIDINKFVLGIFVSSVLVFLISPILEIFAKTLSSSSQNYGQLAEVRVEEYDRPISIHRQIPSDNWDELAGIDEIKDEIMDAIKFQFDPKTRQTLLKMSIKPTRGILLFGPPGTGKTKLARIIAHEAKASFFAVSGTEFTSKWFGESEANLRKIFEEAYNNRPSVLFFDEIEAFLPKRTDLSRSDAPEKGIVGTFLAYTDGIGDLDGVLLVGATNYPNLIDPAALRPGRFDKLIYVSPPGLESRYKILERYFKDKELASDVDLHKLAERMERFTGADIQSVCTEVCIRSSVNETRKI